jgi:outer membrane protein TolC
MKAYIFFISFAILSITRTALANTATNSIVLNSKSVLEIYKKQSLKPKELENTLNSSQLVFEILDLKYKFITSLDVSRATDHTDSTSTGLQQNNDTNKYTWLTTKRFLSGTTLGLELAHLDNALGTMSTATGRNDTNQNYFTLSVDQPIYPNFMGSQEQSTYASAVQDYELKKIQTDFDQLTAQKDLLKLFWKTKALAQSVEENTKLMNEYDRLAKKVQQKQSNQFASAGELEQALSEYETRKQSLKADQSLLSQALFDLKTSLNLPSDTDIKFDLTAPDFTPPVFKTTTTTELKKYKYQQLKLQSVENLSTAVTNSNLPQLSVYGKYTQSGFDPTNSTALDEAKDANYQKYVIGIKMDYTFDNEKSKLEEKIKKLNLDIEQSKTNRAPQDLLALIELAQKDLSASFDNITSNKKILEYRKKAVVDISKNYFQGRTDISFLIDAYNKKNLAEINLISSYGDYETKKIDYQILTLE